MSILLGKTHGTLVALTKGVGLSFTAGAANTRGGRLGIHMGGRLSRPLIFS